MGQNGELVSKVEGRIRILRFNRPKVKNALSFPLIIEFGLALEEAANDPDTTIVVVTGTGDYFTSGNDVNNFIKLLSGEVEIPLSQLKETGLSEMDVKAKFGRNIFHRFMQVIIDFPKPLIAVVNGPAVGMGVTILGLFDAVYASEKATFHTPFSTLGLVPEGCSSYVFPRLMGNGRATEMLMFGTKMTAKEAQASQLVTEVYPEGKVEHIWLKLKQWAAMSPQSLLTAKRIIRQWDRDTLHKVNDLECDELMRCAFSDEFFQGIAKYMNPKSKL